MTKQMTPLQQFDGQLMGMKSRLATAVEPAGMDAAYFMTMAGNYIRQNPSLLECDRHSLMTAVVRAARCGLVLDQATGHANIIKFAKEAVFAPGYPGLIHLAKKHANAADVRARAVYENDQFDFVMGYEEKITHRPWTVLGKKEPGRVIGYYAIIEYKDGFKRGEFIAVDEVNHIKASALRRSKGTGPWSDPYGEVRMGVKTAIIRLFKQIDKSPQLKLAVDAAEDSDAETPTMGSEVEIPAEVVPTKGATIAASIKRDPAMPAAGEDASNAPEAPADEAGGVTPPASEVPAEIVADTLTAKTEVFCGRLPSKSGKPGAAKKKPVGDMDAEEMQEARTNAEFELQNSKNAAAQSYAKGVINLLEAEAEKRAKA